MSDKEIEARRAWLEPIIGPTRAGWYAEACKMEAGKEYDGVLWGCRYREVALKCGYLNDTIQALLAACVATVAMYDDLAWHRDKVRAARGETSPMPDPEFIRLCREAIAKARTP